MNRNLWQQWVGLALFAAAGMAIGAAPLAAQEETQTQQVEAEPVVVTATRTKEKITEVPASVSVVEQEDIQLGRETKGMSEPLSKVPGVFTLSQENYSFDLRISIRGFGARAPFGVRGIQVLVDGIPETTPDGTTQVDALEMGNVDHIEVLRGPASALYGASAGGVVSLSTENPPADPTAEVKVISGSDAYQKEQIKVGQSSADGSGYVFNIAKLDYDGYREHSSTDARTFNGKIVTRVSPTTDVTTVLRYYDSPMAQNPRGLTWLEKKDDRQQAAPKAILKDTGEEVRDSKAGVIYTTRFDDDELSLTGYSGMRNFTSRLTTEHVDYDRRVTGGSAQYTLRSELLERANRLILGVDTQDQVDNRRRYKFASTSSTQYGDLSLNEVEKASNTGVFLKEDYAVTERMNLSLGARKDEVKLVVDDHFVTATNPDDSGHRTFEHTSTFYGLLYHLTPHMSVYGNVSETFEVPALTELYNPAEEGTAGGFNPKLDPMVARSTEIGLRGNPSPDLNYELAVYRVVATDEIIVYHIDANPDKDFFRNAGETERTGAELSVVYRWTPTLQTTLTYSQINAEFTKYESDGVDYKGNKIPGLPASNAYLEVAYRSPGGFYLIPEANWVDKMYADDANEVKIAPYTVVNVRAGYLTQFDNYPFSVFVGVNNATDTKYNDNVNINSAATPTRAPGYYEPAPPTTYYVGVSLGYVGAPR